MSLTEALKAQRNETDAQRQEDSTRLSSAHKDSKGRMT